MVRKYLKPDFGQVSPKTPPSLLDPFKDTIQAVIEESPFYNLVLLAERLRKQGYAGSMTILRVHAAKIRKEVLTKAVLRFESEPGRQAQVDWKECGRWMIDGVERKVYAFVMLLGYSRKPFVIFTTSMNSATLLAAHVRAFGFFRGVPKEILYDNMKTAWLADGDGWRVNPALLEFASQCGFQPRRCQVRRPQTKGKVERFIGYLGNHFLPMARERGLESLAELNDLVHDWLVQVDGQQLSEFCETRSERFAIEQPQLKPWVPEAAPVVRQSIDLMVSREGAIRHETNRYSVPAQYIGRMVSLRISPLERLAELVADGQPIREVILLPAGAHRSNIDPADTRGLRLRWERENRRAKASQARTEAIPGTRNEVAVEIRSPAWYDQLAEVGA
jgi:transposase